MGFLRPAALLLALLLAPAVGLGVAAADDEEEAERPIPPVGFVEVPDVRRLSPDRAAQRLVLAGLNVGRLFDRKAQPGWTLGRVLQQRPPPGTVLAWGTPVDLAVSARETGPAEGRPPPADWPKVALPTSPAPPTPPGGTPSTVPGDQIPPPPPPPPAPPATTPGMAPPGPLPVPPPPAPPAAPAPEPGPEAAPPPEGEAPEAPPPAPDVPGPVPAPVPAPEATGSPDAPAPAPVLDPTVVPALLGLPIGDAEHLAAASEMQLHVERVPGHPVGRVTTQVPDPGEPRPPGGVIRVEVAAGGDHVADLAPAPLVAVTEIAVPDLLDRTRLQAIRILEDLGFVPQVEEAARGPAGRVADQRPDAGAVRPKGSIVIVRVAPTAEPVAPPAPPSQGPPETPRGGGDAPVPLAPAAGTVLGSDRALAIGFTWRPIAGVDAYVVEVEEEGPDGWLPLARRASRPSAVVLEIERLAPSPGPLRWRVRIVKAGRQGAPCAWVLLR